MFSVNVFNRMNVSENIYLSFQTPYTVYPGNFSYTYNILFERNSTLLEIVGHMISSTAPYRNSHKLLFIYVSRSWKPLVHQYYIFVLLLLHTVMFPGSSTSFASLISGNCLSFSPACCKFFLLTQWCKN